MGTKAKAMKAMKAMKATKSKVRPSYTNSWSTKWLGKYNRWRLKSITQAPQYEQGGYLPVASPPKAIFDSRQARPPTLISFITSQASYSCDYCRDVLPGDGQGMPLED
jgi:hypothetical protein